MVSKFGEQNTMTTKPGTRYMTNVGGGNRGHGFGFACSSCLTYLVLFASKSFKIAPPDLVHSIFTERATRSAYHIPRESYARRPIGGLTTHRCLQDWQPSRSTRQAKIFFVSSVAETGLASSPMISASARLTGTIL